MTTKPAALKRTSTPISKPPCTIHPSAIIADKAQITGTYPVEIGEGVVLHPYARIRAEGGRVIIGKLSMVYERAVVGCEAAGGGGEVVVGECVNIETSVVVEAQRVGDGTVVEVNALVGKGAVVGEWCRITALERVDADEELEDFTVVFSGGQRRADKTLKGHEEVRLAKKESQEKAVDLMRKLIPSAGAKWMG